MTEPSKTIEVGGVPSAVLAAAGVERLGPHKMTVPITAFRNQFGTFTMLTALIPAIGAVTVLVTWDGGWWWRICLFLALGLASTALAALGVWLVRRPKPTLYVFTGGVVAADGSAHAWEAVSFYEWDTTVSVGSGGRQVPVTWVELRAGGERLAKAMCPRRSELPHQLSLLANETRTVQARDRLSGGEELQFGEITLNRTGLRARGTDVSWASISEIQHTDDGLAVLVEGRSRPMRVARRSRTPYERALLTVAGEQIAAARDQPGRP
jgi:hypothetical protein